MPGGQILHSLHTHRSAAFAHFGVSLYSASAVRGFSGFTGTGTDCSMRTSDMMELTAGECDAGVVPAITAGGCVMGGF